jgi:hypothetical protein
VMRRYMIPSDMIAPPSEALPGILSNGSVV